MKRSNTARFTLGTITVQVEGWGALLTMLKDDEFGGVIDTISGDIISALWVETIPALHRESITEGSVRRYFVSSSQDSVQHIVDGTTFRVSLQVELNTPLPYQAVATLLTKTLIDAQLSIIDAVDKANQILRQRSELDRLDEEPRQQSPHMSDLRFFPLERGSGTRVDGRPVLPQDLFAMVLPEGLLQAVEDSARKERRPGSSPHNRPGTKGGRIQRQRTQSDGTTD